MESYQIIAGFSDIKSELRTKAKIEKPMPEIQLWFSFEDNVFYVHDYDDHEKCIVLALLQPKTGKWKIRINKRRPGGRLIYYVVNKFEIHVLAKEVRDMNHLYGFQLFRGL